MNPRPHRRAILAGLAASPLFMNHEAQAAAAPMHDKLKKSCKIGMVGDIQHQLIHGDGTNLGKGLTAMQGVDAS